MMLLDFVSIGCKQCIALSKGRAVRAVSEEGDDGIELGPASEAEPCGASDSVFAGADLRVSRSFSEDGPS